MADITGPISTLPGAAHSVPTGTMCDDHPDRPAYRRIQGETDSFGSELFDMCEECFKEYNEANANVDTSGHCDWCKTLVPKLFNRRDYEEGSCGPVYQVCAGCWSNYLDRVHAELDDAADDYDDCADDWHDDDDHDDLEDQDDQPDQDD